MPLDDFYAHSVVFILRQKVNRDGTSAGNVPIGTGFVVSCPSEFEPDLRFNYVVTANHIVEDGQPTLVRLRNRSPWREAGKEPEFVELPVPEWMSHWATDVAIAPLRGEGMSEAAVASNKVEDFVDLQKAQGYWPWLGQRVYFVGLFARFQAMGKRNIPMVRSGTLGALNVPAVPVGRGGKARVLPEAHLIDCRSYEGFSGSPCYTQEDYPHSDTVGIEVEYIAHETTLLGIVSAHFDMWDTAKGKDEFAAPIELRVPLNSGVGVVVPAERIKELIYMDELKADRERIEKERRERAEQEGEDAAATLDSANDDLSEFERFEGLTRKLVNTPKPKKDDE